MNRNTARHQASRDRNTWIRGDCALDLWSTLPLVSLVGARRRDRLAEALGALNVRLSKDDVASIEKAVPPDSAAGERYPAQQMIHLDRER